MSVAECRFCNLKGQESRIIKTSEYMISLVPKHSFRNRHCLVIPRRHVTQINQLSNEDSSEIIQEIGRLTDLVDLGFGSGVMQKYQPLQKENGIKMNHIHFHVFPRLQDDNALFPVPEPNTFEGLRETSSEDLSNLLEVTR